MGFDAELGAKWKARQSRKSDSAINRNAIHGGGDSFDFGGEALVAPKFTGVGAEGGGGQHWP